MTSCTYPNYSTIQAAVDAARPGDTILIAPGSYSETVVVLQKSNLVLRGDVELVLSDEEPCWDTVSHAALSVVLTGSVYITSSTRITVERCTITGPGPGIWIYGTRDTPAKSIAVRFCNLLRNRGGGSKQPATTSSWPSPAPMWG